MFSLFEPGLSVATEEYMSGFVETFSLFIINYVIFSEREREK
jgi:hypothetical protein